MTIAGDEEEDSSDEPLPPPGPSKAAPKSTTSTLFSLLPVPPVPLHPTSTALNVNSTLHRKSALHAKRMPLSVAMCLKELQGLCLACLSDGMERTTHKTHKS